MLLDRTKHLKVWLSYVKFEASVTIEEKDEDKERHPKNDNEHKMECIRRCRDVFERAFDYFRTSAPELKDERAMLLEECLNMESSFGSLGDVSIVHKKLLRKVKRKRPMHSEDGVTTTGHEEFFDYVFPDEVAAMATNLKILEAAYKWKKHKAVLDRSDQMAANGTRTTMAPPSQLSLRNSKFSQGKVQYVVRPVLPIRCQVAPSSCSDVGISEAVNFGGY